MSYLLAKAVYPVLKITTKYRFPSSFNRLTNYLSKLVNCSILHRDPRIVGALRAAVWISNQTNATICTAFREDDAREPVDKIVRGDGEIIPVDRYPILQQLSYSPLEAVQAYSRQRGFFGGKVFEEIYGQMQLLSETPKKMYAFCLQDAAIGCAFMLEDTHVPNTETTTISLRPRQIEVPANVLVKILSTGVCGTDIRGVHGKRKEIGSMTILGHEIFGVVAQAKSVKHPNIRVGSLVNLIPHFWCGTCLPCMTGHTNYCENRKHIGFEHTAQGGFSQYIAVPEQNVVPYPQGATFAGQRRHFAILEPIICCLHARELMKQTPGDPDEKPYQNKNVVIFGAGPIGCLHARLAKLEGAKKVILIDLEALPPEKRARIEAINNQTSGGVFDDFITYQCGEFNQANFAQIVADATESLNAKISAAKLEGEIEVVILAASSRVAYELAIKLVGDQGQVMFFSGLPLEERLPLTIGNKILDIHEIHHHDQIIEVEDQGRCLRLVGAQGFYPRYNGKLWDDFSEERVRLAAALNPSAFVTNDIQLGQDGKDNGTLLVANLTERHRQHLKNLVVIAHQLR